MAVADGLGHGLEAAQAADLAMRCVGALSNASMEHIFSECDAHLRSTRGVAMAIAVVHLESGLATLASVGNIRMVLSAASKDYRFGAARGIVGGGYARLSTEHISLVPGDVLAIFSDGLSEFTDLRTALAASPDISDLHTANLLRLWANRKDDAALLLYRHASLSTEKPTPVCNPTL